MCQGQDVAGNQMAEKELGVPVTELEGNPNLVFQDSRQSYWFGVGSRGVYRYTPSTAPGSQAELVLYTQKDGLCSHNILSIQEDHLGNVYFDTFEGVSKFDGQRFTTLTIVNSSSAPHEWKLEPHDLWFRMGWEHDGPFRYDGKFLYPLTFPRPEQADTFYAKYPNASFSPYGIYNLFKDSKGVLWFGTSSLGICRYDGKSISWLYEEQLTTTPSGGAFGIRSIHEDKEGYFWFTNAQYRYKMLPGNSERNGITYINYEKEKVLKDSSISGQADFPYFMSMAEDKMGNLWMVTFDDGVWQYNGESLTQHRLEEDGENIELSSIYRDNQGALWLVSRQKGLFRLQSNKFESFKLELDD